MRQRGTGGGADSAEGRGGAHPRPRNCKQADQRRDGLRGATDAAAASAATSSGTSAPTTARASAADPHPSARSSRSRRIAAGSRSPIPDNAAAAGARPPSPKHPVRRACVRPCSDRRAVSAERRPWRAEGRRRIPARPPRQSHGRLRRGRGASPPSTPRPPPARRDRCGRWRTASRSGGRPSHAAGWPPTPAPLRRRAAPSRRAFGRRRPTPPNRGPATAEPTTPRLRRGPDARPRRLGRPTGGPTHGRPNTAARPQRIRVGRDVPSPSTPRRPPFERVGRRRRTVRPAWERPPGRRFRAKRGRRRPRPGTSGRSSPAASGTRRPAGAGRGSSSPSPRLLRRPLSGRRRTRQEFSSRHPR